MNAHDQQIVELETKFSFLEQTVEQLNDVVLEQGREIEGLLRRLRELEARLAAKQDGEGDAQSDPLEERPPHY